MKTNLMAATLFGFALAWGGAAKADSTLEIAQFPLASCLADAEYRSASALAADPAGGMIYQAKFRATDWSGQLLAYPINSDGSIASTPTWEAGSGLTTDPTNLIKPPTDSPPDGRKDIRNIFVTNIGGIIGAGSNIQAGYDFTRVNLDSYQRGAILTDGSFSISGISTYDALTDSLINYLRGDKTNEGVTGYRSRVTPLGDIVNSDPLLVGSEDFNYSSLPGTEGSSYAAFQKKKSAVVGSTAPRPRMVYVGANDGMLHGFEAGTWNRDVANGFDQGKGMEIFAYIPVGIVNCNLTNRALTNQAMDSFSAAVKPDLMPCRPPMHTYMVDGSPKAGDAYFSGQWHTVLLGTTGASPSPPLNDPPQGGQGVFALDVTDPLSFQQATVPALGFPISNVLWDFTDDYDYDFGRAIPQPSLARMQNGKWVAIVANGYNSYHNVPVLYILDVSKKPTTDNANNFIIAKISPCDSYPSACSQNYPNGLSTPIAVDVDFDRKVDYIYAGDLQGNLWKFDMNCTGRSASTGDNTSCQPTISSTDWTVANGGKPLFVACATNSTNCGLGNRQPITGKPQVGSVGPEQTNVLYGANQTKPSVMVYFGTGKYLGTSDRAVSSSQQQSFYALWDHNTGPVDTDNSISGRGALLQQTLSTATITRTYTNADSSTGTQTLTNVRVTSNNAPCYQTSCTDAASHVTNQQAGWYLDLTTPSGLPSERSVGFPLLLNGNVVFTTFVPASNPCDPNSQASAWIMELNAISGSRSVSSPFDLFGSGAQTAQPDGNINALDMVTVNSTTVAPSGVQSTVGILKSPALVYGKGQVKKYFGGSTGGTQMVTDPGDPLGRVSWRQLR